MPRSKQALLALEEEKGNEMTANDLVILADGDPFLCLSLLREAENRRSARLGHETSTPLEWLAESNPTPKTGVSARTGSLARK